MANPQPKAGPGRPKGVKNSISFGKVKDILREEGRSPVLEILKLIDNLSDRDQVTTWLALLRFIDSPAPIETAKSDDTAITISYTKQEPSAD